MFYKKYENADCYLKEWLKYSFLMIKRQRQLSRIYASFLICGFSEGRWCLRFWNSIERTVRVPNIKLSPYANVAGRPYLRINYAILNLSAGVGRRVLVRLLGTEKSRVAVTEQLV